MGPLLLSLLIIFELIADILAKQWSLSGSWIKWIAAFVAYCTANIFWLWALRRGIPLGRGAVLFAVASAVAALVIGIVFYREPTTRTELIGMACGVIAIALLA